MRFKTALIINTLTLCGIMLLFETTPLDIIVQDRFFDFNISTWLVDRHAPMPRFFFYNFPKGLLIIFGACLLLNLLGPSVLGRYCLLSRKKALFLLLSLGIVPALMALGKNTTGVYCPSQIIRYGGDHVYVHVLEAVQSAIVSTQKGCCFPAGHASGGFALMSLYFGAESRPKQRLGLMTGLVFGWIMGLYQMVKGAHYLSHTLFTMVAAWLIILLLARLFQFYTQENPLEDVVLNTAKTKKRQLDSI